MKRLLILILAVWTVVISQGVSRADEVKERDLRQNFYRQQMVLLGLYLYGVSQELDRTVPGLDELRFLADSILEVAGRIETTKHDAVYHENMAQLLKSAKGLKRAQDLKAARLNAEALMQSCANCHRAATPLSL